VRREAEKISQRKEINENELRKSIIKNKKE